MSFGFTLKGVIGSWSRDFRARYSDIDIDFHRHGRLLPIYGDTGVGKSTLMYLLAAMKRQDDGTISWRFPDENSKTSTQGLNDVRRKRFGFMYQDARMLPYLSVADNLCYPLRLRGRTASEAREQARATLQDFLIGGEDVDTFLAKYPDELSGGQRRRVAIAKGVIWEPAIFFADEPSSSLDERSRRQVMEKLREWAGKPDTERALIWVSHLKEDIGHTGAKIRLQMTAEGKPENDGVAKIKLALME
jgi:ABC-type lipoprotein export system ATPase subunit